MAAEYIGLVPPAEGFVQTPNYNFARYSEGANYKRVNGNLIDNVLDRLHQPTITALDVAMGHGLVSRLVSKRLEGSGTRLHMYGVDLDRYAVDQARINIRDTENATFTFLQGDARNLKYVLAGLVKEGGIDYTSIHDAIHEIPDDQVKADILKSQAGMLRPGGYLSYNSAFTTEAIGTEWAHWQIAFMKRFEAHRYRGEDVKRLAVHPPTFYRGLMEDAGLVVIHDEKVIVPQDREALEAISEYLPFTRGFTQMMVFPRQVTVEEAVAGMKEDITLVFDRFKTRALDRIWHEVIGQKAA